MATETAFSGARVLVTGAASGLGAALAARFAGAGADVLGTDVSRDLFEHGWNGTDKLLQVESIGFDGIGRS